MGQLYRTTEQVRFLSILNHHKEHLPFPAELEPESIYSETSFLPSELNVQNKTKHKIVKLCFICNTFYDTCKLLLISLNVIYKKTFIKVIGAKITSLSFKIIHVRDLLNQPINQSINQSIFSLFILIYSFKLCSVYGKGASACIKKKKNFEILFKSSTLLHVHVRLLHKHF